MRLALSPAASGLLRALLRRGGVKRDRILLTEFRSTDWQSLTFVGEQHQISLRLPSSDADALAALLVDGIEDHEFEIPGHVVADIVLVGDPQRQADGSVSLTIEALTVAE
ncbi:hypothetical protein H8M03_03865 [Sphingomonas sabuli]|uniref:Uncharacterized protein n=1 Tax=Sphingomonas sabuli TaxID=2764186 RepID=A0A7G9L4D2_9SPHN|nr:hypothetical protein [Sphingomonas sabuli]QNM83481.1 hypothetical protein H8M03_03865 [Sphingomonas sabuli]